MLSVFGGSGSGTDFNFSIYHFGSTATASYYCQQTREFLPTGLNKNFLSLLCTEYQSLICVVTHSCKTWDFRKLCCKNGESVKKRFLKIMCVFVPPYMLDKFSNFFLNKDPYVTIFNAWFYIQ